MGAWGTYPIDSDGALDLQNIIHNAINKELKFITDKYSAIKGSHYDYAGLIMLLLQKGFFIKIKFVEKAIEYMEIELDNTKNGNKSDWKDPDKTIKDIEYLISEFRKLLDEQKKFYLTTNKIGGRYISKKIEKRMKLYYESEILAPRFWLAREHEKMPNTSWSGLLELNE